jgi:uncharacterized membrane protein (DUF106 family)
MSKIQIERLQQDITNLTYFIAKLEKSGNTEKVQKLRSKQQFLESTVKKFSS